jgi:hypothetical protein
LATGTASLSMALLSSPLPVTTVNIYYLQYVTLTLSEVTAAAVESIGPPAGSTGRRKCLRKSMPMLGNRTAANSNGHANRQRPKDKRDRCGPQHLIFFPSGPDNQGPHGVAAEL